MRGLIICALFFTSSLFAEDVDPKVKELEEVREEALYKWRTMHKFNNKLPNDEYTKFYQETWQKYLDDELKFYQDSCKTNKAHCLSRSQINLKKSQVKIVTSLLEKKNEWARQGLSSEEQKKKEAEFQRVADIDSCATHKVGCDKLSEADREVASEKTERSAVVVKPEVKTEVKPEVKTDVSVVTPEDDKPKDEKNKDDKVADETTTVTLDQVAAILEEKLEQDLASLEVEFSKTHPDFKNQEMTIEVKDFLIAQEALRNEKTLEIFATLCKKYPESKDVCLSEKQINDLKEASLSSQCLTQRKFKHQKNAEILASLEEGHKKDWESLPIPRSCEALFQKEKEAKEDKKTEEVKEVKEEKIVEENEDEKSPRNYKAETCRWVSDLPRKILNSPGCTSKGRNLICTGYVVCEQKEGGGKFIRMSTCGADKCGASDADAVRCTKDNRYFSQKPAGESKLFMTPRVKKILSGASEQ